MGLFDGIKSALGVGDFGNENAKMQAAIDAYGNINTPDINAMKVKLQKLVQQGVLTPEQATAMIQNPTAYNDINLDPAGRDAQISALNGMMGEYGSGGMDATDKATLADTLDTVNTADRGRRDAITQNFAERGALGSGEELVAKLLGAQDSATSASKAATDVAGQAAQRALQAMMETGTMGANIESSDYKQAADKAAAADAIARFNTENSQKVNLTNTAADNAAAEKNLAEKQRVSDTNTTTDNANEVRNANLLETDYQNKLQKAAGLSGQYDKAAGVASSQQKQDDAFTGGMLNTIGKIIPYVGPAISGAGSAASSSATAGSPTAQNSSDVMDMAAHGGKIPGKAKVPGDSPKNDRVPAMLSPGEVVVPRSVAKNPEKAKNFVKNATPATITHPDDIESVIRALSNIRCRGGVI